METVTITFSITDRQAFIDAYRAAAKRGGLDAPDIDGKVADFEAGEAGAGTSMLAENIAEWFLWEVAGLSY